MTVGDVPVQAARPPAAIGARTGTGRITRLLRAALPHVPAAVLVGAYVVYFSAYSIRQFQSYFDPAFDMGIFDQGVWLLSHFHAPFVTVMGRNLFGDHASFILLLAVPFYWIDPRPETLLVLQTLALAGGAVPVYLVARRRIGGVALPTFFVAVYLLQPALQQTNLEQFHPEAFLALSVAVALWAAIESRPVALGLAVAASLLVKEDVALLMVPLGVWVLLRRNRRWGLRIVVAAVAMALVDYLAVIWVILGTPGFYAGRIPFGGIGGAIRTLFAHPATFWRYLTSGGRPFYVFQLGTSVGWGFAPYPEVAAIGILTLAENVLSTDPYMHQILYHYSAPLVPVLVIGTLWAVSRLRRGVIRSLLVVVVAAGAIVSCTLWGKAPFSRANTWAELDPGAPANVAATALAQKIPATASVSAWYPYVAHVDHRRTIYLWPNPFSDAYWGLMQRTGKRLPGASTVQYLLLPADLGSSNPGVLASVRPYFRVVAERSGVVLYRRDRR